MISLRNLTLRRGAKVLLDNVSITLNPGEKVGLVGRNGAGKSTVFALLDGNLHEDAGEFSIPPQWRMSQVAQHMPETEEGATAFVLAGDTRLMEVRAALAAAEAAEDGMAIAHAYSDLADAGEHDAVPRAQALILGLGFQVQELDKPVNSFSGGWRMRLQLARALMCPSDLLLLDEPTNHLDLDALVWLEAWLQRYAGTMLVISHDREFLDAVTGVTVHIENQKLTRYGGNYSAFETTRAQQLELQQTSFARQQEKIAHLQKFIDRFKAKASKAKQAQSRVKALERMEKIAPVLAEADFNFEFKEPANLPNPMLAISDAVLGYPDKVVLRGVSRSVMAGQRIGILGANGQGKSTLVKTVARQIEALQGTITEGKGLHIGYFAQQELDVLSPQSNPLEHMVRLARDVGPAGREQELRNFLGSFNFSGDMVAQAVGTMSGGEKARLVLAMIVWQRPNLLLLDEPTNHLDLATREALSVALNEFEGTVMLVSHDRALLRAVCDEFWLVGRGAIGPFDGDLDDYQRYLLDEAKRVREAARAVAAAPAPTAAPVAAAPAQDQRRQGAAARQQLAARTRPLKRELAELEARMAQRQAETQALEARLATSLPPAEIAEAGRQLKQAAAALEADEERWLALSGEIEAIEAAAQ
ncbi:MULTISPECIES: ABC-F family ATP-binding cassette domain-containing protein [Ramlibacter]|uniref:Probable ATP-binding protein YheS n=1 Tax=Ramlibacter pinisoli TaxID=2682844 RepID=A0A6N8IV36_9BURK|nr:MULTISPECIES: ATP-binding cassette domain-containing protein [Ramlibacter]MBA2960749.1 ATP-binding cassette domain-containing protein [Ramlibacter sp. CGMCC 1.13660]MVQ30697.1 ATP-binding cassette domain-containing protein [Ramlibacter pinisoli]